VAGTRRRIVRAKPVEGHPSRPPLHDADGRAAADDTPAIAGALASSTTQAEASRTITTAAIATAALTA
jgi:hypothetical protein